MSVSNAFESLGYKVVRIRKPDLIDESCLIVLPGVGAFGDGIARLRSTGFDTAIVRAAKSGNKILGICLGMQLLFDIGYEFGQHEGLHLIPGQVRKMVVESQSLRLPHIGWNELLFIKKDPLFNGLNQSPCFYFINSYSCFCSDSGHVLGEYDYGGRYCAVVRNKNVFGVQFHPEKSQKNGLSILRSFVEEE